MSVVDNRDAIREFLASHRARTTPEQAGLPDFGGSRRVAGLRRAEVAMPAGINPDYYTRLSGVSGGTGGTGAETVVELVDFCSYVVFCGASCFVGTNVI